MVARKESVQLRQLTEAVLQELAKDPETIWSTELAATFLGVMTGTLQRWRREGYGPKFVRISPNRVGYQKADLLAWAKERKSQSTSGETEGTA